MGSCVKNIKKDEKYKDTDNVILPQKYQLKNKETIVLKVSGGTKYIGPYGEVFIPDEEDSDKEEDSDNDEDSENEEDYIQEKENDNVAESLDVEPREEDYKQE